MISITPNSTRIILSVLLGGAVMGNIMAARPVYSQELSQPDRPYARYRPFACSQVPTRTERLYWRDRRPDTLETLSWGRPLNPETVAEVRACVAQYSVETALPRHLLGLGQAYLAAGNDTQAEAAFRRLLYANATQPVTRRAWHLGLVIEAYIGAAPVRIDKALEYTAMLDALGTRAAPDRLRIHNMLYGLAKSLDSLPFMLNEATAAIRASDDLVGNARRQWAQSSAGAFINKADLEGRLGNGAGAVSTLEHAASTVGALQNGLAGFILGQTFPYTLYGTRAVPLQSTFSYVPDNPISTPLAQRPTLGKVALVVLVDKGCYENDCFSSYAILRRLMTKYPQLEVTLVTRTDGYDRTSLITDAGKEAAAIRKFFQDDMHLSAPVLVWKTAYEREADDNLRFHDSPNAKAYTGGIFGGLPNHAVLVDKTGTIRQATLVNASSEQRLDHMVANLLRCLMPGLMQIKECSNV
jgi:hypothetical protein